MGGTEWLVEARDAQADALRDKHLIQQVCAHVVDDVGLHVIDQLWHQFPFPGGVTGMYLLSESHLTVHTFPELGQATFNLYCCRPRSGWDWETRLQELIGAEDVQVQVIERCGLDVSLLEAGKAYA